MGNMIMIVLAIGKIAITIMLVLLLSAYGVCLITQVSNPEP